MSIISPHVIAPFAYWQASHYILSSFLFILLGFAILGLYMLILCIFKIDNESCVLLAFLLIIGAPIIALATNTLAIKDTIFRCKI